MDRSVRLIRSLYAWSRIDRFGLIGYLDLFLFPFLLLFCKHLTRKKTLKAIITSKYNKLFGLLKIYPNIDVRKKKVGGGSMYKDRSYNFISIKWFEII